MATVPQTTSYYRYRIDESWQLFSVPSRRAHRYGLTLDHAVGQHRHDREQGQKKRRRPRYCQVAPLSLRFHSQMRPRFFKGHFHSQARQQTRVGCLTNRMQQFKYGKTAVTDKDQGAIWQPAAEQANELGDQPNRPFIMARKGAVVIRLQIREATAPASLERLKVFAQEVTKRL